MCLDCFGTGTIEIDCDDCGCSGEGCADGTTCDCCHGAGVVEIECEECSNNHRKIKVNCNECEKTWWTSNSSPQCSRCGGVDIDPADNDPWG